MLAPINPNADHLGSEESQRYWRMPFQHCRALAGALQLTASSPPALVNNTRTLPFWTAHTAVSHDDPRHQPEAASFHRKLLQLPSSLLCAHDCVTCQNLVPVVRTASQGQLSMHLHIFGCHYNGLPSNGAWLWHQQPARGVFARTHT